MRCSCVLIVGVLIGNNNFKSWAAIYHSYCQSWYQSQHMKTWPVMKLSLLRQTHSMLHARIHASNTNINAKNLITNKVPLQLTPISNEFQKHSMYMVHTHWKRKCHFDEILITGCTGSCHFDNFQCSQWWQFHQNENISASVLPFLH